jgi:hypothetical protein
MAGENGPQRGTYRAERKINHPAHCILSAQRDSFLTPDGNVMPPLDKSPHASAQRLG